jgi:hypothetical protein
VVKKGFEVSNRQSLLKSISKSGRPSKTNKVSKTDITGDKVKAKKRNTSKRK